MDPACPPRSLPQHQPEHATRGSSHSQPTAAPYRRRGNNRVALAPGIAPRGRSSPLDMVAIAPTAPLTALRIAFAGGPVAANAIAQIDAPWLGGAGSEDLFPRVTPIDGEQGVRLFRAGR